MNIVYPLAEILKCVEIINQPKKKYYNNNDKIFNLNNTISMKKKIKQTQGTFGDVFETEELVEETFDDAQPFEIDEIKKINNSEIKKSKKNNKKRNVLALTREVVNQSSKQKMNKKYIDILEEESKLMTKITNENKDQLKKYINFNLSLNKQVAELKKHVSKLTQRNVQLENDFNKVSKELNQQPHDKEFQIKLDLIYKQQNIIKDYQDQISKLKKENQLLEQNTELPPSWLTGDLKFDDALKGDKNKVPEELSQQEHDNELKAKFIHEQQNIIKDYEDQISKLKEENQLLTQDSEKTIHKEDNKKEKEDIAGKIKHYQDDNLRLSNELVKLSSKLENTKSQLAYFENNKARLMSQLDNLNNIVSESNVIGNPFDNTISKIGNKLASDKTISSEKQITQDQPQKEITYKKIVNHKEMNILTKEIFKK